MMAIWISLRDLKKQQITGPENILRHDRSTGRSRAGEEEEQE
jgi:hypothetical protein